MRQPGRARAKRKVQAARTSVVPDLAVAPCRSAQPEPSVLPGCVAVEVKFMGELTAVVGQRVVRLSVPQGSSVADLLALLSKIYGEAFTSRVFSPSGKLHHYIIVFVGGEKIQGPGGFDRKLEDGEVSVVMLPMFVGG